MMWNLQTGRKANVVSLMPFSVLNGSCKNKSSPQEAMRLLDHLGNYLTKRGHDNEA